MTKEQAIEILEGLKKSNEACIKSSKIEDTPFTTIWKRQNEAIETVLSMLEEKDKTISSKDKIIDLMANHIATSDSDLCEYLDITTKCKYYAGDNGKTCDNCIKQYFENKAKEVK